MFAHYGAFRGPMLAVLSSHQPLATLAPEPKLGFRMIAIVRASNLLCAVGTSAYALVWCTLKAYSHPLAGRSIPRPDFLPAEQTGERHMHPSPKRKHASRLWVIDGLLGRNPSSLAPALFLAYHAISMAWSHLVCLQSFP